MSEAQTDGAVAPADDTALFDSVIAGQEPAQATPQNEPEAPAATTAQNEPAPATTQQTNSQQKEPSIPPGVLREEKEARRALERELGELRGRLAALTEQRQQPQPQTPQQPADIFENPQEAIRQTIAPQFEQMQQMLLTIAKDTAVARFSEEKVNNAEAAFIQAMQSRTLDPADYQRVANAPNRYAACVQWFDRQSVLKEVGNDPAAYKARILEEALKDPEFLQKAQGAVRTTATQTGNTIARPAVSSLPSIARVGAAALPQGQDEASDEELFAATTKGRKRA